MLGFRVGRFHLGIWGLEGGARLSNRFYHSLKCRVIGMHERKVALVHEARNGCASMGAAREERPPKHP